ncbi:hypothetical protein BOO71_0001993 [Deinococcus marmoris]|uniref:Uncharacterized protein n=1 Tax=Deinococcus marmoris TaxID=249408 RepID=A0A1U7P3B5_9DEIO|nr:hypothetical protein BOO71_0001993 [Deinococcus marmoris]
MGPLQVAFDPGRDCFQQFALPRPLQQRQAEHVGRLLRGCGIVTVCVEHAVERAGQGAFETHDERHVQRFEIALADALDHRAGQTYFERGAHAEASTALCIRINLFDDVEFDGGPAFPFVVAPGLAGGVGRTFEAVERFLQGLVVLTRIRKASLLQELVRGGVNLAALRRTLFEVQDVEQGGKVTVEAVGNTAVFTGRDAGELRVTSVNVVLDVPAGVVLWNPFLHADQAQTSGIGLVEAINLTEKLRCDGRFAAHFGHRVASTRHYSGWGTLVC